MTSLSRDVEVRLKGLVVVEVVVLSKTAIDKEVGGGYTSIIAAFRSTLGAARSGVRPRGSVHVLIGKEAHGLGWRVVGP